LRSAAEPQPKETSTTEARRHGENSKANNQQSQRNSGGRGELKKKKECKT